MIEKLKDIDRFFVGFDVIAEQMSKITADASYPPFNLKKYENGKYEIQLAVAGYDIKNIDITVDNKSLVIKGFVPVPQEENVAFLWKGISARAFTRQFAVSNNVKVKGATLVNGILTIKLESILPDNDKPTKIKIEE